MSNLEEDGGAYLKGTFNQGGVGGGGLFNFSQILAWHDYYFSTSSRCKQQHKLFINVKSWS